MTVVTGKKMNHTEEIEIMTRMKEEKTDHPEEIMIVMTGMIDHPEGTETLMTGTTDHPEETMMITTEMTGLLEATEMMGEMIVMNVEETMTVTMIERIDQETTTVGSTKKCPVVKTEKGGFLLHGPRWQTLAQVTIT